MAHSQQRDFFQGVKNKKPEAFTGVEVLEVGSLNINGTVRDFFDSTRYIGADVAEGKDVDVVCNGENLDYPDNSFDVAVSAECFEHNPEWVATFRNMWRMSKKYVMMTCASEGRAEHGTTRSDPGSSPLTLGWDYYRNLTEQDFRAEFNLDEMFDSYYFDYNADSCDLYFYGEKKSNA
jgi:ubiquinone/menaquinone biosynthesis C-methylase UbiE